MKRAKDATLVVCLFVVYCVLLSQGLKASAASAFFGALRSSTPHRAPLSPAVAATAGERRRGTWLAPARPARCC